MLHKTRGIVLNHIRYKESSIIVRIYTEELGLQSYIVNSVRSKSAKTNRIALFQPLTLLDLVVYHKDSQSLHRLSEHRCLVPFHSIPFDIRKSSIALFMGEILNKVLIKETSENNALFEYVFDSINELDRTNEKIENFHLRFLITLLTYIGIKPLSAEWMFDCVVTTSQKNHQQVKLSPDSEHLLDQLLEEQSTNLDISGAQRRALLQLIINYYDSQIENFGMVKSLDVLREVLS